MSEALNADCTRSDMSGIRWPYGPVSPQYDVFRLLESFYSLMVDDDSALLLIESWSQCSRRISWESPGAFLHTLCKTHVHRVVKAGFHSTTQGTGT